MPGQRVHNRIDVIPFRLRPRSLHLITCSVCLRVREGGAWIEVGEAIRRLRTFEHEHVVRLGGALCECCELELRLRRRGDSELAA
jgi:hypothetical protein